MSTEKPLHVLVAEALGWRNIEEVLKVDRERSDGEGRPVVVGSKWFGSAPPDCPIWGELVRAPGQPLAHYAIPIYEEEWRATGPLIERYGINLSFNGEHWFATTHDQDGEPFCYHIGPRSGFAPCSDRGVRPLESVCRLILALHAAGKLEPHP